MNLKKLSYESVLRITTENTENEIKKNITDVNLDIKKAINSFV